jgi:predicted DNA-binding ribbon-helix-helix protein
MKTVLNIRVEESRHQKLREVAKERKKTMTQLVEDWIDRLPNPNKDDSVA